jgi:tRNA-splicing ligase RtcB
MTLAGEYAYAGREWVARKVVSILGGRELELVHNHHNFAWRERHGRRTYWVHRKGATPAFPGQRGFVGGTMGEPAVILEGRDVPRAGEALFSTVHGAGRVMSRTKAAGKFRGWGRQRRQISRGVVNFPEWQRRLASEGIALRGGGADEAPECYKRLSEVLAYHGNTVKILHTLRPIGVAMAGDDVYDPFKD